MKKSMPRIGDRPDWYRGLKTKPIGDYFGSTASIALLETYVTADLGEIVHRTEDGKVSVCKNICPHAGAQLRDTPGKQDITTIVCPVHNWGFKPSGELLGAPYFHEDCRKTVNIARPTFGIWNGYIIGYAQAELDVSLADFGSTLGLPHNYISVDEFVYNDEVVRPLPYPRPLMAINYLDILHVPMAHKGTFNLVADVNTSKWELGAEQSQDHACGYSIQVVRARPDVERRMESMMRSENRERDTYGWASLHLWLKKEMPNVRTSIDRDIFAVWAMIYGNGYLMLELYEGGLFLAVSSLVSKDGKDNDTENLNPVEYYVHKSVPEAFREPALRRFKHAYDQSADEDDALCMRLWNAHQRGDMGFNRIYHEVLEAGDADYREWFLRHFVER